MNTLFEITPTNKHVRALRAHRLWFLLEPIPQGCRVEIASCQCPIAHCECEFDIELHGDHELWLADEHKDFVWRMQRFLRAVDPANYRDLPTDPVPIKVASRKRRIAALMERVERGYPATSQWDIDTSRLKLGEQLDRARNGTVEHLGLEELPNVAG